ncbi:MAG: hypothetical protein GC178_08980 [Flavobacteriales bacterium]|nr:hypothetical protein [Flavobacteriales bacterium]
MTSLIRFSVALILSLFCCSYNARGQNVYSDVYEPGRKGETPNSLTSEVGSVRLGHVEEDTVNGYTFQFKFPNDEKRMVFVSLDTLGRLARLMIVENDSDRYELKLSEHDSIMDFDAVFGE